MMKAAARLEVVGASDPVDRLIIGRSRAMSDLRRLVRRVAETSASVMLHGPSGAGKEVVARAIHEQSSRAGKPFVAINCGAIPPELMESELFGHERGAFTGAHARRLGRFEEASGGTLFLDEIGDMRFDMQVKLLRVLEDRVVTRVGGSAGVHVDLRIICATHQDIQAAIEQNRFRQDLFFRLSVLPIILPRLADRVEDIPMLMEHFCKSMAGTEFAHFSQGAILRLQQHSWPGNVRELRNLVERANVLYGGAPVGRQEVDDLLGFGVSARPGDPIPAPAPRLAANDELCSKNGDDGAPINLRALLETMELERIQIALDRADGVVSEAARLLTLKRTTLIEKMRKYSLDRTA